MNRLLGALRGATSPGHQGGHARPAGGVTPGAGRPAGRSGGLMGLVTSVLGNRRRRY
ncbi:hypothetical protein I4I73_30155 [Pseudonocardia sp. KRD-184]|uniref:Uncharacterized protein n=1 Tax=Pseudonocardia oceani TaxID=2792013 RepID=A0ABS6U6M8_9PSEU|nr:hypothetical protein [Pseudonocardia oceani]MBW0093532.1 hypothetical protein [Pseudonocardia oceani]MBW0100250.1 hypothetical protein [Pseudonocardia oceani]MBW0112974.1 hypothetical protein [Pseudonocardia oceani]MBW0125869.1 hypothetical protein [Pseudonocardia oceani]MBW0127544.1 hypothetical protein [Pseudonocardia oceani]